MLALATPLQNNASHDTAVPSGLAASTSRTRLSTRRAYSSSHPTLRSTESFTSYPSSSSSCTVIGSSSTVSLPVAVSDHQQGPHAPPRRTDLQPTDSSGSQAPPSPPPPNHQSSRPPSPSGPEAPQPVEEPKLQVKFDIHTYPSTDLIRLLATLLNEIAVANDNLTCHSHSALQSMSSIPTSPPSHWADNPTWNNLFTASRTALSTPTSPLSFHARNVPSISLESYLLRILRYCPTTNEVFLSLLVYFDRMSKLAQDSTSSRFAIDSYNVHRLVIAGVTVASKFFSDVFYTNSRYAKVGGLPQAELNQLELQFLLLNDFKLMILPEEMQRYAEQLILFSEAQSAKKSSSNVASNDQTSVNLTNVASHLAMPSRPMQSMGAFDAFGGHIVADADEDAPRNKTPRRIASAAALLAIPSESSLEKQSNGDQEQDSTISSETDTDTETDDEPTIRPAHSGTSSETQSLYETDSIESAAEVVSHNSIDERGPSTHPPQTPWRWTDEPGQKE